MSADLSNTHRGAGSSRSACTRRTRVGRDRWKHLQLILVFVSEAIENIPSGYRARETYTILSDDQFMERFEIAQPVRSSSCTQRRV